MENSRPHVAIIPNPGIGHLIPLIEFAKRLVTFHDVYSVFFIQTTYRSVAQSQLIKSHKDSLGFKFIELPPVDVSDIPPHADTDTRIGVVMRRSMPALETTLSHLNTRVPTLALIADLFSTDAFDVARRLGLPKYLFCSSSAEFLAFALYLPILDREIDGEFFDLKEPLIVPGCTPIPGKNIIGIFGGRRSEGYGWFLNHVRRYKEVEAILVNTWEELESKPLMAMRENDAFKQIPTPPIYTVGPLIKQVQTPVAQLGSILQDHMNSHRMCIPVTSCNSSSNDLGLECLWWLDKQPAGSVLFVSFGSGGSLSSAEIEELAWGLEQSQQRFLWVLRRPSDISKSASFFYSGGREDINELLACLPRGFVGRTKELGLVVPCWAPQVDVLNHRSIGGFLSHCGWNSTLETIFHGVPVIAWPLFAEQRMNASMLEELKVAVWPTSDKNVVFDRNKIERVVRLLMVSYEGKVLKAKAKQLKDTAIRALSPSASSYYFLSKVVSEWKMAIDNSYIGSLIPN